MLKLLSFNTAQLTSDVITITWNLESSTEDFNQYRLSVYQSMSPVPDLSLYTLIASGINPAVTSLVTDTTIQGNTDKWVDYFYRIVISGLSGQGVSISDPQGIAVTEDKYAREIERRRKIVFNMHSGQIFYLLKRRSYGQFCPNDYDPTLQRTTSSNCTVCYGTGYVNGYYEQMACRAQLNERPTREMHQLFSQWQDQDAVLYMPAMPPLNPKDIVVDKLFRRWLVLNVGAYQKSVHTIGQIVQLRQIERADVIYQFPIDFTMQPST